jgi:teichuronic acid biosynthesis glycosyltransferase TuaH
MKGWSPTPRWKEYVRPFYLKYCFFHLSKTNRPTYFADCWNFPREEFHPRPAPGRKPDFVFLPMSDWHTRIQRTQHLARTLGALGHRCLYVNPHLGREFASAYPWSQRTAVTRLEDNVFELHVHLPREPVYHSRLLDASESRVVIERIEQMLQSMGSSEQVVVASLPTWAEVALGLRAKHGSLVLYDCHDWIEGFEDMAPEIISAEPRAMDSSDAVLFSSAWLREAHEQRLPAITGKASIVRNAVDAMMFPLTNQSLGQRRAPCIGYAGSLAEWIDFQSIRAAALAHPDWRFILIGRVECPAADDLRMCGNIELIGEVPHARLPEYFSKFDVGIIPFLAQPLIQGVNPIKLYEYFACGLPVVTFDMPEIRPYADMVYTAASSEDFKRQLEAAVAETNPNAREARRRVAEREHWGARSEKILEIVSELRFPQDKYNIDS